MYLLAIILASFITLSSAHAETNPQNEPIWDPLSDELAFLEEELEVQVATKTKIPLSKAPGAITVISHEQIRKSGASSIPALLRLVPGANVRWNPMMQTIDLRGFGQNPFTNRVLLLIDGVPYNSWNKGGFPQQPGFDFFPIENVKQLEVVRGPGSSLYGENAYWGVINIVTLSGKDMEGVSAKTVMGARNTQQASIQYGKSIDDGSFFISTKYLKSQYPMKQWYQYDDSDVDGTDLYVKGQYKGLELSYYRHEDEVEGFSKVFQQKEGPPPGSEFASADIVEQVIDIVAMKFEHDPKDKPISFSGDLSYSRRKGSHCAACHDIVDHEHDFSQSADHGYQAIGDFRMGIDAIKNHDILLGVEYRIEDAGEHDHELGDGGDHEEDSSTIVTDYAKTALYIQDQISLLDDKMSFVIGARYDGPTSNDLFEAKIAPRVAVVHELTDKLLIRTGWSKAHRFPSFSEMYQETGFVTIRPQNKKMINFVPNLDLQPESIQTFDLGFSYQVTPSFLIKTDLFYSELEDFIILSIQKPEEASGTALFENHPDEAKLWGGELEFRGKISPRLSGFIHLSYLNQKQKGDLVDSLGKKMEFVYSPEFKVGAGLFFRPFTGISGALEVAWKSKQETPSFWAGIRSRTTGVVDGSLDDYALVNLRLNYDLPLFPTAKSERPLQLSLYGSNLLNEVQEETMLMPSPDYEVVGRETFIGLSYNY